MNKKIRLLRERIFLQHQIEVSNAVGSMVAGVRFQVWNIVSDQVRSKIINKITERTVDSDSGLEYNAKTIDKHSI